MVRERTEELRDGYQWPKEVLMDVYSLTPSLKASDFWRKSKLRFLQSTFRRRTGANRC